MSPVFNETLEALVHLHPMDQMQLAPTIVPLWLRGDFAHGTDQQTTIAPHKTDPYAECCVLTKGEEELSMSLSHHMQQLGNQTLQRMQCIAKLDSERREVLQEHRKHRETAAAAQAT